VFAGIVGLYRIVYDIGLCLIRLVLSLAWHCVVVEVSDMMLFFFVFVGKVNFQEKRGKPRTSFMGFAYGKE
jgi:hypothetical protein